MDAPPLDLYIKKQLKEPVRRTERYQRAFGAYNKPTTTLLRYLPICLPVRHFVIVKTRVKPLPPPSVVAAFLLNFSQKLIFSKVAEIELLFMSFPKGLKEQQQINQQMNPLTIILSILVSLLSTTTCFGMEATTFLTKRAWTSIDRVLFHPRVTPQLRERVHRVIYESYETWAFYQAREFTQHHYYKCRHIPMDEWKIYAARGLVQAIEAYEKGKAKAVMEFGPETHYSFSAYARSAIRWSLFLGLTNLSPLSHIPKDKRIRKRAKNYTLYRPTIYDYEWVSNIAAVEEGEAAVPYAIQERLDVALTQVRPFTRRIFQTKYLPDGETRYSNKEVALMMNCSEETIRKHLHKVIAKYQDSRLE